MIDYLKDTEIYNTIFSFPFPFRVAAARLPFTLHLLFFHSTPHWGRQTRAPKELKVFITLTLPRPSNRVRAGGYSTS
jgi:hypothetical protein